MKIDDLVKFARLEMPGILDAIIVQAIAMTAYDFCVKTKLWDEIQDPVALVDDQAQYDMDAPNSDAMVVTILNIWATDRELISKTMGEIATVLPMWQSAKSNQPQYFNAARDWKSITVYPTPTGSNGALLTFRVICAPKITATTLPDFLGERYFDAMLFGAKARLFGQAGVAWENQALSKKNANLYDSAVVDAQIHQFHDRVPGSVRVKPVRFG